MISNVNKTKYDKNKTIKQNIRQRVKKTSPFQCQYRPVHINIMQPGYKSLCKSRATTTKITRPWENKLGKQI